MRTILAVVPSLVLSVAGSATIAAAEPVAAAPIAQPYALITLTTIPSGWETRTDLRPVLEIYSDGHAIEMPDAASADRRPETPPRQLDGTIGPEALQAALTEIRALAGADFGTPPANGGVRIIDLMPQAPDQDVHLIVYSPDVIDGFGNDQRSARQRFADLYRRLLDAFVKS
ncbi:hypothetical protein [Nocardia arizonensis]|uniref:hypothetical protein n=1 Tax=Nocardia arizonensis TaxID=1141647 RepID=UPI0006CFEBC8|nr:hypothetical protein [Nocardia arizonensis]